MGGTTNSRLIPGESDSKSAYTKKQEAIHNAYRKKKGLLTGNTEATVWGCGCCISYHTWTRPKKKK